MRGEHNTFARKPLHMRFMLDLGVIVASPS
jgi:hypothetical protein